VHSPAAQAHLVLNYLLRSQPQRLLLILFTYALSLNWFCEVKLYEFNAQLSQAGPPSGQTLIASVVGEVTGISGSFTSITVTLGSGLAPIGSQVPPRQYTTALIGTPLKI